MPPHYPLATDEARYQGDGVAVVVAESRAIAKDAAELVEVDYEPLDARRGRREGARRRRAARPLRPRHERVLRVEARDGRRTGRDRRRGRRRHAPVLPAAADPERDGAARGARGRGADRRGHALVGDPDPAHPPLHDAARARDPRVEDARDRARRRRRLRLEARRVRRGVPGGRAREAARASREVDGGAERELRRDDPRPRRRPRAHVRGDEGREDHGRQVRGAVRDGRVSPARDARDPAPRRVDLLRPVRDPELQRHVHRRLHEHDADRRVSRCRTAGGDVRARADDGRARRRARHGPVELRRKNFIEEFPHTMASGLTIDSGDYQATLDRLLEVLDLDSIRADQEKRRSSGRREADRRRLLDVQRDVRSRSVAHPRRDPVRGRRLGERHDPLPAARLGAGRHRDVAARPGARDGVGADRRRPARRRGRRRRGAARRHGGLAAGDGQLREPLAHRRRHRALARGREGASTRRARSSRTSSRWRRTISSSRTGRSA